MIIENELVTLDEVSTYLRLDDVEEEKSILKILIKNAEIYIEDASILIKEMDSRQVMKAKLLALVLVSDWYDNRSLNMKVSEKQRFTVQSLLRQLQL
ncbi:head-tail connector protein [Clostridium botulinum]|uniref:head-tail connector protein n=1 Tax=Clostridium botulinum TaxID=1491 RepID=UPI001E549808|nr:head-tail connector protein [Clostridium botulinum]MCD3223943.1 phage gp6-like head-tail connector protein [Clostridium botulinum C/D]